MTPVDQGSLCGNVHVIIPHPARQPEKKRRQSRLVNDLEKANSLAMVSVRAQCGKKACGDAAFCRPLAVPLMVDALLELVPVNPTPNPFWGGGERNK